MSLANILQPNDYDIFVNSITTKIAPYVPAVASYYMQTTTQSIPSGEYTTIVWNAKTSLASFPAALNVIPVTYNTTTGVFTCIRNCIVSAAYQARFTPGNPNGRREIYFLQSNIDGNNGLTIRDALNGFQDFVSGAYTTAVKIGDTFQIVTFQSGTGGAQNLQSFSGNPNEFTSLSLTFNCGKSIDEEGELMMLMEMEAPPEDEEEDELII